MKCAIYVRTNNQGEILSQKEQIEQIEQCKLFLKNNSWSLQSVYQDHTCGTSIVQPGLQQLLKDASEENFNLVIVKSVSRISREHNQIKEIFQNLSTYGVHVLSLDEFRTLQKPSELDPLYP